MCKLFIWGILLQFMLLWSCGSEKKGTSQPPKLTLQTALLELDTLPVEREFIGYLEANFSAVIQPRLNAWLVARHYENGMPVKRGERLFTLDESETRTSRLAAAAEVESARARLLEAKNNYERALPLVDIEAISRSQFDQYEAQYGAARAALTSAEQSLKAAELKSGYTRIDSPIDGVAASSSAHVGDYVGPGTRFEVLTTISNIDTLSVDLALPMSEYLRLVADRKEPNRTFVRNLRLYLSDGSLYPHAGSYGYTKKDVSANEGSLLISVNFPNPDRLLRAGQFARVRADLGAGTPRLLLPAEAVMQTQGVTAVWVVEADSTVNYRPIAVGDRVGSRWSVSSGLEPGERVLLTGLQKVKKGMKINY